MEIAVSDEWLRRDTDCVYGLRADQEITVSDGSPPAEADRDPRSMVEAALLADRSYFSRVGINR